MFRFIAAFCLVTVATTTTLVSGFQTANLVSLSSPAFSSPLIQSRLHESYESYDATAEVDSFLATNYPDFHSLMNKNPQIWTEVKQYKGGSTFFVPNSQAFENLGEKKLNQMKDDRNTEAVEKMAAYHVIAEEALGEEMLLTEDWTQPIPMGATFRPLKIEGIVTLGGEVPVGRSKSGGFFGIGGTEEEKIVLGPNARIVQSFFIGNDIIHEIDEFLSPDILWRYFDQLRIPGI